ncbi:MAG TPA: chemotaxis protein CheW [Gemmatimonadaceae bacterium]|jgi:purine-binding chemotaxis protein CheW
MNGPASEDRVAELREAFDLSFSRTPAVHAEAAERLLTMRIGGERYALRLNSVSGLVAGKRISWVPSPVPELLGIAGFRGTVRPVYDLAMLLGHPRASAPRWIVLTEPELIGLAFEGFDGFVSVSPQSAMTRVRDGSGASRLHVNVFMESDGTYPIVDITSVITSIARKTADSGT